jgi:hypothetical protein
MAKEGLWISLYAAVLMTAGPAGWADAAPTEDRDSQVAATLAVQTAMQRGRDFLLRNNARAAVEALEAELPRINGNPAYLALLRDSYRAYLKELNLTKQEALAKVYLQRLNILEPGSVPPNPAPSPKMPVLAALAAATPQAPSQGATPTLGVPAKSATFRGYRQEEDADPFRPSNIATQPARELLAQADRHFSNNQFGEAERLYEQAHEADAQAASAGQEQLAYCKLHRVVALLNARSTAYDALDRDVQAAMKLAPRIEFGKQVQDEIAKRRAGSKGSDTDEAALAAVAIRDLGRTAEGWSVAETTNYRIYYTGAHAWAERTAQVAERTRARMYRKWFGEEAPSWDPKCDIFLHATAPDYSRATGVPPSSPGHSSFRLDGGRVLGRRIDLHCDDAGILDGVLPHEATHVVLAGNFGTQPIPRWADEGIAVLTEPRDKIDRHLRNLPRHRDDRQLFALRQLMQMSDYPEATRVGAFYAQSVSLVEFLSKERDAQVFTQFVRDGLRSGWETALQRHYGYRGFDELEQRWYRAAFTEQAALVLPANP